MSLISHFPGFFQASAMVKKAACLANTEAALLDRSISAAIIAACSEIIEGELTLQPEPEVLPVRAISTACQSHALVQLSRAASLHALTLLRRCSWVQDEASRHIATRATEILAGTSQTVSPTEHVDLHQSEADCSALSVKLTALHMHRGLADRMRALVEAFHEQAGGLGKTLPQLGEAMTANGVSIANDLADTQNHVAKFFHFAGDSSFNSKFVDHLSAITGVSMDLLATRKSATDTEKMLTMSNTLRRVAVKVSKLSAELNTLSSSRGQGESQGHELVSQLAFQVVGQDLGATMTVALPSPLGDDSVVAHAMLNNIQLLERCVGLLREQLIELDVEKLSVNYVEMSVEDAIRAATRLIPIIGYENSCTVAKHALANNRSVESTAVELGHCTADQLPGVVPSSKQSPAERSAAEISSTTLKQLAAETSPRSEREAFEELPDVPDDLFDSASVSASVEQSSDTEEDAPDQLEQHMATESNSSFRSPAVSTPSETAPQMLPTDAATIPEQHANKEHEKEHEKEKGQEKRELMSSGNDSNGEVAAQSLPPPQLRAFPDPSSDGFPSGNLFIISNDEAGQMSNSSSLEELVYLPDRVAAESRGRGARSRKSRSKSQSPTARLAPLKKAASPGTGPHGMRRVKSDVFNGPTSPGDVVTKPRRARSFTKELNKSGSSPTSLRRSRTTPSPITTSPIEAFIYDEDARAQVAAALLRDRLPLPIAMVPDMRTSPYVPVATPSPYLPPSKAPQGRSTDPLIARWMTVPENTAATFNDNAALRAPTQKSSSSSASPVTRSKDSSRRSRQQSRRTARPQWQDPVPSTSLYHPTSYE